MEAQEICLLASRIAKGGTGMVALAGQMLTLVLEELKLTRNLKMNRVTQTLTLAAGTNGPFNLESDYLRTYDMFYPLATPQGMTQFLTPVTMEQYDSEFKAVQTANYPYEFATDLSTQALATSGVSGVTGVTGVTIVTPGFHYTSVPTVAFAGGVGSGASALAGLGLTLPQIGTQGAGYAIGDYVFGAAGTFTRPVKVLVLGVGGGGTLVSFQMIDIGDYSVLPGVNSATTTTGGGAGFTFTTPYECSVSSITMTSPGLYTVAPAVSLVGGAPTANAVLTAQIGSTQSNGGGLLYIYPQSNALLSITHRYMRNQPDIPSPETSTTTPWFPLNLYLIHRTAALMMGITGDDREQAFLQESEKMLAPYLIMEGDEQKTVQAVGLDPRRFRAGRYARPTKTLPY